MSLRVQTTSLGKINNIIQRPRIIARILKVWDAGNPSDGSMCSVDFILVDEEGTAIEGTIETAEADEIKSQMVEGSVCEFTNFQVKKPTRIGYKSVKHEFILNFTPLTTINRLAETNAIPTFYFNFEDLEDIGSSITQLNTIVDIVGKLSTFKSLQMIPISGKRVPLREIEVENERGTIVRVILWGEHNNRFNEEDIFQRSTIQPIVIAFSSLELVKFCGLRLKTYSATRIVDEEIPQIAELKKKFRATPLFISPKRESRRQNANNEELATVTVKELLRNYVAHKTKTKAKCTGTIVDVLEAFGWYDKGCPTHNTKVRKAPYGYKCEHCNTNIEETKPCFQFLALLSDDTNERVDVIFFEEQGKLVTGSSASQVYLQHQLEYQLDHDSKFPNELYNLIGREFNFTLRFKANSAHFGRPTFYVDEAIPTLGTETTSHGKSLAEDMKATDKTETKSAASRKRQHDDF